jgi:hypothetical protein
LVWKSQGRSIHLTPVSAKICIKPSDYFWSSYRYYININIYCEWLKRTEILNYFSESLLKTYEEFIFQGVDDKTKEFYEKTHKTILGSERFIKDKLQTISEQQILFCSPSINHFKKLPSLEKIASRIAQYFNVDLEQLKKSKHGQKNIPRMFAIFIAKQYGQVTHKKIAHYFTNIKPNSVSTQVKRLEVLFKTNIEMQKHMENINNLLSMDVD